ncbi:hypothetical protein [Hirschia baltica]|uniref:Lipoprotein n=1 Tax=Hirschia baltica (strain ATCC 49814 / DSM 5838 / IFAM 1418) TaxID=582402 RepID=C6XRT6_HIRBI|nr:hypothetical protein [Hirschia baltica]ACT60696.1 hypothetical protein Hbal_3028 [Hirschia baltica ATCC 49814]
MRHFMIGASAIALLAACGADDDPKSKSVAAVEKSLDSMKIEEVKLPKLDFKAKDYGQTAEVLAALKLDGEANNLISFADSSTGKGGAVFKDVSIKPKDEDGPALIAKTMTFDGLNMTDEGPSFDRLVLADLSLADEEEGVNLSIGDISIVEPNAAASKFFAALIQGEEPEDIAPFSEWAFDRLSLSNLSVVATPDDEEGTVSATIGELSMASLADAIAGQTLFSDIKIDFDIPEAGDFPIVGSLNLGTMSLSNLQTAIFDEFAEAGSDPEKLAGVNSAMMKNYTSPIDQGFDQSIVEDLSLSVSGLSFTMPKSATKVVRNSDGVATGVVSPKTVMKLSADADGGQLGAQVAQALAMMDYSDLEMSIEAKASYDPETDETRYTDYSLDFKDAFALSFNGGAYNLLEALKGMVSGDGDSPDMDAFNKVKLSDLEISLEDKSILDRAFKVAADMQGMEAAQVKSMATGMLAMGTMQASQSGADMELVNQTVNALTAFIENSGTLTIKLDPEAPISVGDFEDPSKMTVEALGFSATAK